MPTPQRTSDDANPETTHITTKLGYKFDCNIKAPLLVFVCLIMSLTDFYCITLPYAQQLDN